MAKKFTLGKNERLKSRKLIEQLFNRGKVFVISPYRIFYFVNKESDDLKITGGTVKTNLQFGVGVSGKNFKRAVDRNRIKRLTREAWRLQKRELQEVLKEKDLHLNVFFVYTASELTDFNAIKLKVGVALKKFLQLKEIGISS